MITAKVKLTKKTSHDDSNKGAAVLLSFDPDYQDGRNKAWAEATPHLSLTMTVQGAVAARFTEGAAYTLQFVEEAPDVADEENVEKVSRKA